MSRRLLPLLGLILLLVFLAACSAATPAAQSVVTQVVEKSVEVQKTAAPAASESTSAPPTQAPAAALTATAPAPAPTQPAKLTPPTPVAVYPTTSPIIPAPTSIVITETRTVELEWPASLRLGESDIVRLALVPYEGGYKVTTDFPEHPTITQTVNVSRPGRYDLWAVGRLEGVGFEFSPAGDQALLLPKGETVTWRWSLTPKSSGRQRISVTLRLRWVPEAGTVGTTHETSIYSKALEINVTSFLGMTRGQAMTSGLFGLIFGSGLSAFAVVFRTPMRRARFQSPAPNASLAIEARSGMELAPYEKNLLQMLFHRYGRLVLENEFLSGYSGARTFLAQPIRPDGRADAYTIVKIGERESIRREFENYETYVKDTLPPITARIQHAPVTPTPALPNRKNGDGGASGKGFAAVQYTFIGAPGQSPHSLRQELLENPDPGLLEKLFNTFGPNWWMQRHPYTFRLAQEYDRVLPAHLVIEPVERRGQADPRSPGLDGSQPPPAEGRLQVGEVLTLRNFREWEVRADGKSLSLLGETAPGHPALRVRWLSLANPNGAMGRIVSTRQALLSGFVTGLDRFGLPDPLDRWPALLNETVSGTQSTIHGDLNLENVLVGPGGFVWLIDFAQTRNGHPLFDFAHLEGQIIAHVIAAQGTSPAEYASWLQDPEAAARAPLYNLRTTLHGIAGRCLFNPSQPWEYDLALFMTCLGALKYTNLDARARHLLYLSAAHLAQTLLPRR